MRKSQSLLVLTRSVHLPAHEVDSYLSDAFLKKKLIVCSSLALRNAFLPRAAAEAAPGGALSLELNRVREMLCQVEAEISALGAREPSGTPQRGRLNSMQDSSSKGRGGGGRSDNRSSPVSKHDKAVMVRNKLRFEKMTEEEKATAKAFKHSIPSQVRDSMWRGACSNDWAGKCREAQHCKRCGDAQCRPEDHDVSQAQIIQKQIDALKGSSEGKPSSQSGN